MDYDKLVSQFSWEGIKGEFDWNWDEKFNMAHECCDKWALDEERIAVYWENEKGETASYTYLELSQYSNQLAHVFKELGLGKGDRISGLLGKEIELVLTVLAAWKIGAIYVPMFTAFGPKAIDYRLRDSGCSMVITNKEQAQKIRNKDIQLLLIDSNLAEGNTLPFWKSLLSSSSSFQKEQTKIDDPAVIQYTSGSTGMPKGAVWSHKILVSSYPYVRFAMGLKKKDIFFGGPDMGWAYGLMNCTFFPLSLGTSIVIYKGKFDVQKVYRLLEKYHVTNVAYAPTAYRMMMSAGAPIIEQYELKVNHFSSAGEPLNAEVIRFFDKHMKRKVHDHYGSTETGMIINNLANTHMIVPGSMGKPSPGFQIQLLDSSGREAEREEVGEIAVDANSFPFFFLGYWNQPEKTEEKMTGNWFRTGDLAVIDKDGYFWFQGRSDDIISSAGYRIGPFEVESSLIEHEAVSEAAVIGIPDANKGEIVKAYVVLNSSFTASNTLAADLIEYVKTRLSKHQYPREIEFVEELPKTPSGKIQRYKLKQDAVRYS